jgi:hypothetical protein
VFTIGASGLDHTETVLGTVPGVRQIGRHEGRWTITADRDVRGALQRAVLDGGGTLTHMSRDGADLDAIYHRYFRAEGAEHIERIDAS